MTCSRLRVPKSLGPSFHPHLRYSLPRLVSSDYPRVDGASLSKMIVFRPLDAERVITPPLDVGESITHNQGNNGSYDASAGNGANVPC